MLVMANWKMNGGLKQRAEYFSKFNQLVKNKEELQNFIFFPPATLSILFSEEPFFWGAQNFYFKKQGAYTGENSIETFKELGAKFSLIGHSERRYIFGESDIDIEKKFHLSQKEGLIPVLCVGETESEINKRSLVLRKQLSFLKTHQKYKGLPWAESPPRPEPFKEIPFIIAYEPLWAIGKGEAAPPEEIQKAIRAIRDFLSFYKKAPVVYGGSVNPQNTRELTEKGAMDGFLVGNASLDPAVFYSIYKTAKAIC